MLLIGTSDGSVSVMKKRRDGSGQVDLTSFPAHSVPLEGILFNLSISFSLKMPHNTDYFSNV